MIYPGIELDQNNKVKICPLCENESIPDGEYCQICGTMIVNRCTNKRCGIVLSGNSRYCHKCSEKSTFSLSGFLKDWKAVRRKYEVAKVFASMDNKNNNDNLLSGIDMGIYYK